MEQVFDIFCKVFWYLFIVGILVTIFKIARDNAKKGNLKKVLWKGFLYCATVALFGSFNLGSSTCEEYDPLYGGCDQYADDGFKPTRKQKTMRFTYIMMLFYTPCILGSFYGNKLKKGNKENEEDEK